VRVVDEENYERLARQRLAEQVHWMVYVALCRGKPFRIENRPQNLSFQVCVCVCVRVCGWV
jgi:hypothetical protein